MAFWQTSLLRYYARIMGFSVSVSHFVPLATVYFCGCGYVWLPSGMRDDITPCSLPQKQC